MQTEQRKAENAAAPFGTAAQYVYIISFKKHRQFSAPAGLP